MIYRSDYRLENFIRDLRWEDLPEKTKEHAKMCTLDLFNAVINLVLVMSANWISRKTTESGLW